jgi:hypothetical protein
VDEHRVSETTSLLSTEQPNGHEEDFTLLLHRVLHSDLHLSEEQNLCRIKEIADLKSWTLHAAQNWVRPERSDPIAPQNRGPIPSSFGGHSRVLLLESAARILAKPEKGSSKFCKTGCKTKPKRGTKVTHGNHQATTQTTQVVDDPSSC